MKTIDKYQNDFTFNYEIMFLKTAVKFIKDLSLKAIITFQAHLLISSNSTKKLSQQESPPA